ncbi:MAG TPA: type II toxin-antitoxin system VapC family toxin [Actinomycetota bacterium]
MTDLVLDASVLLKWFAPMPERGRKEAVDLRKEFEEGRLSVIVPSLIFLEVLNVAGRRWGWERHALADLASALDELGFDVREPELPSVAAWVAQGLTAYDAAYVALAERSRVDLVSDDDEVFGVAGELARPLVRPA